jgi:selenocysteine lyase/cysteine desulfurase
MLLGFGVEAMSRRIRELTDLLCARAEAGGWRVYSSRREGEDSGIVSLLAPEGVNLHQVAKRLRGRGVVVSRRAGRLRVSPHAYNSPDEVEQLAQLLRELT